MTKESEVTVTDAEVEAFKQRVGVHIGIFESEIADALAAFLAARVPDKLGAQYDASLLLPYERSHNALRDAVLRGPQ